MHFHPQQSFVGASVFSENPGIIVAYEPPASFPEEIDNLGPAFRESLAKILRGIHFPEAALEDASRASKLGELLVGLALHMQRHVGASVVHGQTLGLDPEGRWLLFYECETSDVGARAGALAAEIVTHIFEGDDDFDPYESVKDFISYVQANGLLGDQRHLMSEARKAGFPATYFGNKWLQLGRGRHQRTLWGTITDRTPWSAVERSTDKVTAIHMFRGLGLPVPEQFVVQTRRQALEAARTIGYPVVVKPRRTDRQVGVSVNIKTENELGQAFDRAAEHGRGILVESLLPGEYHRILIVDGVIVSALEHHPALVIGDGERTVTELVEEQNFDPRRGVANASPLAVIELDDEAKEMLAAKGYTLSSVPAHGEHVVLRRLATISRGGTVRDVTDIMHAEVRDAALLGARALGLDLAGVDYITPDITRPHDEVGGGICEINGHPGLRGHYATAPRDVAKPIFEMLFPGGRPPHVPIVSISQDRTNSHFRDLLTRFMTAAGHTVGVASRDGLWCGDKRIRGGDATDPITTQNLLRDVRIDAAILETPIDVIVEQGLGVNDYDVAVLDAVRAGEPGELPFPTIRAFETLMSCAKKAVIIDVNHPLFTALTTGQDTDNIIIISTRSDWATVKPPSFSGTAVVREGNDNHRTFAVIKADGSRESLGCSGPDTRNYTEEDVRADALAIASAVAIGIPLDVISAELAASISSSAG